MNLIRRMAMKISELVVRYASSGCKEWAAGLAREVEFIEGDWAVLGWALGSVRVLLDRREVPMITSLADVSERARLVLKSIHKESSGYMVFFILAFVHVLRLPNAGTLQQRIGCGLISFAATYQGIVLLAKRRTRPIPQSEDERVWALYYRSELERQLDFHRFGIGAAYHFALFLGFMGLYLGLGVPVPQGDVRLRCMFAAVGVLCLLGYGLVEMFLLRQRWQAQNQIIELDAVLKETR